MQVELTRTFFFEAAHQNPEGTPAQQRMHGHSYAVELVVRGEVESPFGWLIDYGEIKAAFQPIYDQLDHAYLNELPELKDTRLRALQAWIAERAKRALPMVAEVRLFIRGDLRFAPVRLGGDPVRNLPERIRFTFEAAQSLPQLPVGHHCHNLHGHSYRMEIGAADLDGLEPALEKLYEALDHTNLDETPGLEGSTCEQICRWVWRRLEQAGQRPAVVVVQETEASRCAYYGR